MSIEPYPHHVMSLIPKPPQRPILGGHLLPAPTRHVTWPTTETPTGLRKLLNQHRPVFLVPLLNPLIDGAMATLHYANGTSSWGGGLIALGAASAGLAATIGVRHAAHPAQPHPIGTHHPGHHTGPILGTAFAAGLILTEFGVALLNGPFAAGTIITGIVTTIGVTVIHALHLTGSRRHTHALETERIKAVAALNVTPFDGDRTIVTSDMTTVTPGPNDRHPYTNEILRALQIVGVEGATVTQLNVTSPQRWNATINLPDGTAPTKVIAERDRLQGALKIRNGGLTLTPGEGGHQVNWSVNNVPLAELPAPGPHPITETITASSIWDPIPLGIDDDGHPVTITIAGTPGILIAGAPGSGKSNASAGIVCTVVRADDCRLWTIDGSGRELVIFDKVADHHVRTNLDDAIDMLGALQQELDRRGEILADLRATEFDRQLARDNNVDCLAYAISELAFFTRQDTDPKKSKVFNGRLADIVARGRACGVFGIFDTQKPEASVVPSSIRDMVPLKLALRCETDAQVGTILGQGMHTSCPAHHIDVGDPGLGVAYIKGIPGRKPFRMRTHRITPKERYAIVDQAASTHPQKPAITQGSGDDWDALITATQDLPPHPVTVTVTQHHYPDGTPIPDNALDRWNLLTQFPDGFTWSDLVPLQVPNGRSRTSWQNVLNAWQAQGWIKDIGKRGNATLYIRTDLIHATESNPS